MRKLFTAIAGMLLIVSASAQKYYRPVTFDHTKVPNTVQLNFPVLVSGTFTYLKTTANGGKVVNPNGYDIQFTKDSLGNAKLSWEVERYNPATGELVAWVKVDTLSPVVDRTIYLQYGDNTITTFQGNVAGTWNSAFTSVYHLKDGTILSAADATSNSNNGTITGASAGSGQMAGSAFLSGAGQYISVGNSALVGQTGNMSIEAWIKPTDYSNFNGILSKTAGNQPKPYDFYLFQGSGQPIFFRGNGTGSNSSVAATASPTAGAWSHIVVTVNGSVVSHYLNGNANGSGTLAISGAGVNGTENAYIGTRGDFVTMFKGGIDEVRISNTNLSADWIKTEYNNQSSPATFYAVGAETIFGNQSPVASAGAPQTIILPASSVSLTGSGSDPDGTVIAYAWSQVSGPNSATISSPASANTNVTNLIQGVYIFKLTVTDDKGATGNATVTITVNPNQVPTANAGTNQYLILPTNSTTLTGSGNDTDGTIASYSWSRLSGPNTPTFGSANTSSTTVSGMVAGVYTFRLTVTDNLGGTGTSDVTVTVNATNQPPTANAGANQTIFLPTNSVTLTGAGSDLDGSVAGYAWSQVSGPNSAAIVTASAATTIINGLIQGSYVFQLAVTDNLGATSTATVLVTVNATPPPSRYFRAITIDHSKVPNTNQLNFPVLISGTYTFLKTIANGGKVSNANGFDIMFANDTAGSSKLNWEVERYNPATGELIAWVKTDLSPTTDKVIYMLYGDNTISTFQGNIIGTWNSSYNSVYHLKDGTTLSTADVTVNANNGTNNGAAATTGQVDGAASLNGSSNYISIGTGTVVGVTGDMTIEAWINPADFSNFNGVVSKTSGNQPKPYDFYLFQGSGQPIFFRGNGSGSNASVAATASPVAGAWSHIVVTTSGNTVTHYLNGVPNGSGVLSGSGTGVNGSDMAYIGTRGDFVTKFKGKIDEVRISSAAITADWVKTEYNNQSSPATFYAVGIEKTTNPTAPTANAGPNQTITGASVKLTGTGSSPNGAITGFVWTFVSGPNTPNILTANKDTTTVTGMATGTYVFRLTVTDVLNATGTSDVAITVSSANISPTANAGTNQTITLPTSSVTLSGTGIDTDGTVSSYNWSLVSGPNTPVYGSQNSAATSVSSLIQGVYVFRLTVTDNGGATGTSDVTVTVNGYTNPPSLVTTPLVSTSSSSVALTSSATSPYTITSTKWSKFSVPGQSIKRLTVVGSSTTAGNGLPTDSVYINKFKAYYKSQVIIDTVFNLAISGTSVFDVNITAALNFGAPVLLVNYPSNAYGGNTFTISQICAKYQEIADSCAGRGVQFYTTGTQPRNDYNPTDRLKLIAINDSLRNRFGPRFIDFLTPVLNTYDNTIKADYSQGDGIHENSAGHERFFQLVRAANVFQNTISSASSIATPNSANTSVNGLVPGVHKFQISVADGQGLANNAVVQVTVTANLPNQPPVAKAGADQTITLPVNTATLDGTASTDDHNIVSYQWTKLTGTGGTLATPNAATTAFSGLTAGVYTVELKVTDDSTAIARDTVQITVNPPLNTPPVAKAGTDQSITLPVNAVTLDGTASTDDHNIVSYQWTKLTGTGGTLTTPNASSTTFTGLTPGVYTVELKVTDDSTAFSLDTVQITVYSALNTPPVAKAGADQTITLPVNTATLDGTASTDDHNIVSYQWTKLTGTGGTLATPNAATTAFSGLTAGVYTVELKVTDDSTAIARDTVQITVNPPLNTPPVAKAGTDQSIILPVNSVTLNGTASTDDHNIVSYQWTKLTGTGGTLITPNASTTTFTGLTPGVYTVELKVTDDSTAIGRDTVQITVNYPPNTAPVARAGADQSIMLPVNSVTLSGTASTDDHNIVSYQWTKLTGTGGTLTTPNASTTTFTGLTPGVYMVELKVTDDSTAIGRDTVQITVNYPPNTAPVARAGADQTITLPVNSVTLNGSASTDDHTIVSYQWTKLTGSGGTLSTPTGVTTSFTGLIAGVYTVELKVTDDSTAIGRDTIQITVNAAPNQAPVARAGADQIIAFPSSSVNLSGSASTDDHNIVSYQWTKLTGTGGTLGTPNSVNTTFSGLSIGVYTVELKVTDDSSAVSRDTVQITVANPPNQPPVVNAGADQTINMPVTSVTLTGTATDDHNITAYLWTKLTGTGGTLTTPTALSTTFTGLTAGTYTVELKVTDDSLAVKRDTVQITVIEASILDPNDVVVTYNGTAPAQPYPNVIGKWIRTKRMGWNTDSWKCYIYNGVAFRLKFPKTYVPGVNDGKKYPMLVFFHGLGEAGPITDNEYQMYHGGDVFNTAVNNGTFDGYVLMMQSQGFWGGGHYAYVKDLIDYMVVHNKLDQFQIMDNGLSAGGQGTWEMLINYTKNICASIPMSSTSIGYKDAPIPDLLKFTPMWNFSGGADNSPAVSTCEQVRDAMLAVGGNFKYTEYPDLGHGTWDRVWTEADFWPFMNRAYKSNPWTLFGRTEFCPGDPINVTIGLTAGFNAYEWRKDGVLIPGATGNTIVATSVGTYSARVNLNGGWSEWSRVPVVIKTKTPTVTPPITVAGLMSNVIPAVDTSSVTLQVPAGYASYVWQKVGDTTTIGTSNTLSVSVPGSYIAKVTEQFGCSSSFSTPFVVVNANGTNKPSPASGLIASTISKTAIRLDWSDNPAPQFNETNFEIYQASQPGGPYKLIIITPQDVTTDTVTGLNPNSQYYFVVRAVNNNSAAANSNEATASTSTDTQAPTAPTSLVITNTTRNSVILKWNPSSDDVAVTQYDVYVNGQKSYITDKTTYVVYPLVNKQSYTFFVKARDFAGNVSPASNQVSGEPLINGLKFKNYTLTDPTTSVLPDFTSMTPDTSGVMANVDISTATQQDYFAYLWEGYVIIPTTGTYRFQTTSDDGSRVYLGSLNGTASPYSPTATPIVNNDGLHGVQSVSSSALSLTAGVYPIAISFFESTGGQSMSLTWRTPSSGTSFVTVPNSAFAEAAVTNGPNPADPANLIATAVDFRKINLTWTDNSNNEIGFEIWRSTSQSTGFTTVGSAPANATSYTDSLNLNGNTKYYYRIKAIGQYGESALIENLNFTEANWKFNNNYIDSTGNAHTLTAVNTPVFDAANKMEGTHAVSLNGTNQSITVSNSGSFLQEAYNTRSVAFWMRSNSNTGSRTVFDFGGADDGLAMQLNTNQLIAGIAGNNVRATISTAYTSTGWNHIALVYSGNTLRLYVNGVQAASNTALTFSSLTTTTNAASLGVTNGTNAFNTAGTFFSGWLDNFHVFSKALSVADINNLMLNQPPGQSYATTAALPALPLDPKNLLASSGTPNSIQITWKDTATNETGYELYRSNNNNLNYVLYKTLPVNAASFTDTGLFAHTAYYYKVRANGLGGNSGYSNEDSAKAGNNNPVINDFSSRSARYGTVTTMNVTASDPDSDPLSYSVQNKPAFVTLTDNGNNTATLTLNPQLADQGVYSNIRVIVNDGLGGKDTTQFDLTVNDNYDPQLDSISDVALNEGDSVLLNLHATDQNPADVLTWSLTGIPSGYVLTPGFNGSATLKVKPGFAAAGTYNASVTVSDGHGGTAARNFVITVVDKDPSQRIYVGFDTPAGTPWNSLTSPTMNNLKDSYNASTGININLQTNSWVIGYLGPQTGNNSGVYPDNVIKSFHYFGLPWQSQVVTGILSGLSPARKYNFTFYAGSVWDVAPDNGSTNYTINGQTVSLYVQNNTQNTVSINNVIPAADGTVTFTMAKGAGATVGYLNALVVTYLYDDGTVPVAPANLTGQYVSGQGVKLNWQDIAYNETATEIYRATNIAGPYTLAGTINAANAMAYTDSLASGTTQYYYKVRVTNTYGPSPYSNVFSILTPNRVPVISPITSVTMKNNQALAVNITALDDATDHITLTAKGLPSFATLTDNGNGTGVINITPALGSIGIYTGITITAKDNSDSSRTASFDITVTDKDISSVYINFSDGTFTGTKPWNNFSQWPSAGATMSGLLDDSNTNSGMTVTLLDNFEALFNRGMHPGNGTTVYPESVMRTAFFESTSNAKRIKISGLSSTKKYNFVFFNSHDFDLKTLTNFTINGQTVSLDATYNTNKTIQINGIAPDVNGEVTISMAKATSQDLAVINTLVIQAYSNTLTLLSPTDLRITNTTSNSIKLQWADRAFDETGFQIWRATDAAGSSYSLLTTVAANTTSYTDNNLASNKTYYYSVRAAKSTNSTFSAYCNPVSASTDLYNVYVNCTGVNNAPLPWNNTDAAPVAGATWDGFADDQGQTTSTGMAITQSFSEVHPLGMNTGNNSGVYPDQLLQYSYYVFPGVTGKMKITGLNMAMKYDLTFIGSSAGWGDLNSAYTVNGKTYYLNAALNVGKGTVTVYQIVPDKNGEINVSITRGSTSSVGGYLNAFILSGYTDPTFATPTPPVTANAINNALTATDVTPVSATAPVFTAGPIVAYPNPFMATGFSLNIPSNEDDQVLISVIAANGQQVFSQQYNLAGHSNNLIAISGSNMKNAGVYLVRMSFTGRKENHVIKLIKQ